MPLNTERWELRNDIDQAIANEVTRIGDSSSVRRLHLARNVEIVEILSRRFAAYESSNFADAGLGKPAVRCIRDPQQRCDILIEGRQEHPVPSK